MPGKPLYSSSHDREKVTGSSRKAQKRPRTAINYEAAKEPTTQEKSTVVSAEPTQKQRELLRQRQLETDRDSALRDKDIEPDHRRRYEAQGEVYYSEPRHRAPRMDARSKMPVLPGDPDLEQGDTDLISSVQILPPGLVTERNAQKRIAEISLTDQSLSDADNALTTCYNGINQLRMALDGIMARTGPCTLR